MFQLIGLVYIEKETARVFTPSVLFNVLEKLCQQTIAPKRRRNVTICTTNVCENEHSIWETTINMTWPYTFSVQATGKTYYNSQFKASLLAAMDLKVIIPALAKARG